VDYGLSSSCYDPAPPGGYPLIRELRREGRSTGRASEDYHCIVIHRQPISFQGQVAIVTGGASGIGRALCEELSRRGAVAIAADINIEGARAVASASL